MQPNTTNRRPGDLPLDEPATSLKQPAMLENAAGGLTGVAPGAPLFTKDSPTLGAGVQTPSRSKRSTARSTTTWAVAVLIVVALVAIASSALHQHRVGDGETRGLGGVAAPNAAPADKSR